MTRRAVVEVLGPTGVPLGLGFVVEGPLVVTCAHVVNAALGREPRDSQAPEGVTLQLRFPYGAGAPTFPAELRHWSPHPSGDFESADLAILSMSSPLPADISPFVFADAGQLASQAQVHLYGPVAGRPDGGLVPGTILGPLPNGRLQLNQEVIGSFRAVRGFSGGPAWLVDEPDRVAGMLVAVATAEDARDAYVMGIDSLKGLWPSDLAFPKCAGDAMERAFIQGLLDSPDLTSVFLPALGNVPFDRIFVAPFVVPYDALAKAPVEGSEEQTALDAISRSDRAVLVAGPGMGKTTLLRFLTRSLVADGTPGTLPVLVSLSAYAAHGEQRDLLSFGLQNRYGAVLRRDELERLDDAARVWNREGRLLFLLDGLDEVSEDRRRPILEEIGRLRRFVVASRPLIRMPFEQDRDKAFQLAPMSHASVVRFVRNWASGVQSGSFPADQVLERLRIDARLADLARTPQLLSLICWLMGRGSERIPLARLDLLAKAVGELIASAVERGGVAADDTERLALLLRSFLRQLALERLESTDETSVRFSREEFGETAERLFGAADAHKLTRLALWSGLVVAASGDDDDLQFLHLVFHEYLAAEALVRSPDLTSAVERVRLQSDCEECLRMACGILSASNDDQKLRVVLGGILEPSGADVFRLNYRLAARCLAMVADADRRLGPIVEQVAGALLEGASEWWARSTFTGAIGELGTPTTRNVLVAALRDEDQFVRWAAAEGLASMADPASMDAISDALSHEQWPPVIGSLIKALGLIGDLAALPEVMRRAEDASGYGSHEVGAALGRMNAIGELEALLDRGDDVIGDVVVEALPYLPTASAERLTDALKGKGYTVRYTPEDPYASARLSLADINDLLESPRIADHLAAVKALARRDDWAACWRLSDLLTHEDDEVVAAAVRGLIDMLEDHVALDELAYTLVVLMLDPTNDDAATDALALLQLWMSDEARNAIEESAHLIFEEAWKEADLARLMSLVDEGEPALRAVACWALTHVQDDGHDQLLRALADEDDVVRQVAAWSVGRGSASSDLPVLLDRLTHESVVAVVANLVAALGQLRAQDATPALLELLGDDDDQVRAAVIEALGLIGGPSTSQAITPHLTDRSADVRYATVTALHRLRAGESVPLMTHQLGIEEDPAVKVAILDALGDDIADPDVEAILACLDTDDVAVRMAALETLGLVGDEAVGHHLLRQLSQAQTSDEAKCAITAIGRVADPAAITAAADHVLQTDALSPLDSLVQAVAQRGHTPAFEALVGLLSSREVQVTVAGHTVELVRGDRTARSIWHGSGEDVDGESPDPLERWDAVHVWSSAEDDATVHRLAAMLRDEEAWVASAAAGALNSLLDDPRYADVAWQAVGESIHAAMDAGDLDAMLERLLADRNAPTYRVLARPELLCPLVKRLVEGADDVRPVLWNIGLQFAIRILPDGRIVTGAGEVRDCEDVAAALQRSGSRIA